MLEIQEIIYKYFDELYETISYKLSNYNYNLGSRKSEGFKGHPENKYFNLDIFKKHTGGFWFSVSVFQNDKLFTIEIDNYKDKVIFNIKDKSELKLIQDYFKSMEDTIIEKIHSVKYISPKNIFEFINGKFLSLYNGFNSISEKFEFNYGYNDKEDIESFEASYYYGYFADIIVEVDNSSKSEVVIKVEMFCDCETGEYDKETLIPITTIVLEKNNPNFDELDIFFNRVYKELELINNRYL